MNTYKITFTRENGTVGSDNFTAPSEAQARRDFKEVYRHGNGTITSVELVSSDAPATKRQEPVSYTHLDVYKRQGRGYSGPSYSIG